MIEGGRVNDPCDSSSGGVKVIEGAEPRLEGIATACLALDSCVWEEDILTLRVMEISRIQRRDQAFTTGG